MTRAQMRHLFECQHNFDRVEAMLVDLADGASPAKLARLVASLDFAIEAEKDTYEAHNWWDTAAMNANEALCAFAGMRMMCVALLESQTAGQS